ncbi:MAG: glycosyl transferase [Clostridia bacterium]|nr:glycosyl transferase [Clostridia bacterium]
MSIPKVIYYCWFGKGKLPKLAEKCINSWKKYCPDYQIVCINEENFDVSQNQYAKEAYEAGKWAFVSDFARLKVLFDEGGIYFDTDVELIKPLDPLLAERGFMGFDDNGLISTGLGFACEQGHELIGALLNDYEEITFIRSDGSYDLTPCPDRNTNTLEHLGMDLNQKNQVFMGIHMLPEDYLCPVKYYTGKKIITNNTYSIHHFCASWTSATSKRTTFIKRLIGVKLYEKLYGKFLHKFKWLEW